MSISAMRRCSATSSEKRTSSSSSAAVSIGRRPRTPLNASEMLRPPIMRRASVVFSGGRPSERSFKISTSWPPAPNRSTGPNWASVDEPRMSS